MTYILGQLPQIRHILTTSKYCIYLAIRTHYHPLFMNEYSFPFIGMFDYLTFLYGYLTFWLQIGNNLVTFCNFWIIIHLLYCKWLWGSYAMTRLVN